MKIKQIINISFAALALMFTMSVLVAPTDAQAAPKNKKDCESQGGRWVNQAHPSQAPDEVCIGTSSETGEDLGGIKFKSDSSTKCGDVETSILSNKNLCKHVDTKEDGSELQSILTWTIWLLSIGVGVVSVGGFIYGAILYTSAGSNAEQVKKAHRLFINISIGLLAYGLMVALMNFLIPGGVFK